MTQQVEISLCRMVDALIDHCASQSVPIPILVIVHWEEPGVMPLLHHQISDWRFIARLQLAACLSHSHQFFGQHSEKLTLANSIPVHDETFWLTAIVLFIELLQESDGYVLHILNHLFVPVQSGILDPNLNL